MISSEMGRRLAFCSLPFGGGAWLQMVQERPDQLGGGLIGPPAARDALV